jgi:hypothetical protein
LKDINALVDPIVRAAVVQAAPMVFDTPRTVAKLIDLIREAASHRVDLVVFPASRSSTDAWLRARNMTSTWSATMRGPTCST